MCQDFLRVQFWLSKIFDGVSFFFLGGLRKVLKKEKNNTILVKMHKNSNNCSG